jgi:serine/threonine protein kinase
MRDPPKVQSLLAEGTYGCVFYPALPCKKGVDTSKKVSKLTRIVNSELELDIANAIRTIPKWEDYYILSYEDNCSRKEIEKFYDQYKDKCDILHYVGSSQLTQLISPYGGMNLHKYIFPDTFSMHSFLKHMVQAVSQLHTLGYGHFDIHTKNILIDEKGVTRLIDFGKSVKGDKVDKELIERFSFPFTPSFDWQPPELAVMNAIQEGQPASRSVERVFEQKGAFRKMQTILGISIVQQEKELREFWNFSQSAQSGRWDAFFRHYWRKFDVWSLGVLGVHILSQLLIRERFVRMVWQKESASVIPVLKGMVQADPRKRLTIEKVLELL